MKAPGRTRRHEVVVAGGGPAGVVAALAAAREGADVLLVERLPFLGGTATASMVGPWMAFHAEGRPIVAGIAQEIVDRLVARGGCLGHVPDPLGVCGSMTPFDTEILKLLLVEMCTASGVKLALHTLVTGQTMDSAGLESVEVHDTSGASLIRAQAWIDTSGDATLAHRAGVPTRSGRDSDGLPQPMTMVFKMGGVDETAIRAYAVQHPDQFVLAGNPQDETAFPVLAISGFFDQVRDAKAAGDFAVPRDRVLVFGLTRRGEVTVNMTRIQGLAGHIAFDLTAAEIEGARQVDECVRFLTRWVPGFQSSFLLQTATQIGLRETRRIVGAYVLTREDVVSGARFADGIALGGFPIDIHAPAGAGVDCPQDRARAYHIPYRCLVPRQVPNLLVAGRCLSATFEAHASARITPTCMAMGQAAGMAAARMARQGRANVDVSIGSLQADLRTAGALLE